MTRHQYGISAVISQTSFPGGTSGGVVNPNAYVFQTFRACLHGGGGPRVGEVTCLGGVKKYPSFTSNLTTPPSRGALSQGY